MLSEVIGVGPWPSGISVFIRTDISVLTCSLFPFTHSKRSYEYTVKVDICNPRGEPCWRKKKIHIYIYIHDTVQNGQVDFVQGDTNAIDIGTAAMEFWSQLQREHKQSGGVQRWDTRNIKRILSNTKRNTRNKRDFGYTVLPGFLLKAGQGDQTSPGL